jgi:hypothetical protein
MISGIKEITLFLLQITNKYFIPKKKQISGITKDVVKSFQIKQDRGKSHKHQ